MGAAFRASVIATAVVCAMAAAAPAQRTPRTPDGRPDFQGIWLNNTATPLERLKDLGGRPSFTDAEARVFEQRYQLDRTAALSRGDPVFELNVAGDLDTYEPGRLLPGNRSSIITDPADGRVPPLTPEAQQRFDEKTEHLK